MLAQRVGAGNLNIIMFQNGILLLRSLLDGAVICDGEVEIGCGRTVRDCGKVKAPGGE